MREISYPRKWRWPAGQKLAMSVGLALGGFARQSQFTTSTSASARNKVNHFSLSYAEYGWKAGVWRLRDVLDRYGLKAEGYIWNGDDASDDLPFLRDTDHGPMVIMPRTNSPHNDLTMWLAPRNPPSILWEQFKASFDTLYAEGEAGAPKWMELTLH